MDTAEITHVSLCAGYGGIDLGLKRAVPKLRTVAFSEIEAFACANLVAKMEAGLLDAAPVWTDLKTFPWASFHGKVDILSGGYPCQPFSAVGKRLGADDPRHLWPFIADGIVAMQPRLCFFENVEGHISLGLRAVIEELGRIGYRATWGIFSAAEVGAPHQRKRVFILAHRIGAGLERISSQYVLPQGWEEPRRPVAAGGSHGEAWDVFDTLCNGGGESGFLQQGPDGKQSISDGAAWTAWPSRPGEPQHEWEPPRVVGDAKSERPAARRSEYERLGGELCATSTSNETIGDAPSGMPRIKATGNGWQGFGGTSSEQFGRQAEPALGGDADGPAYRMDDAQLYVASDNRTDELRLLGNGVVPATAERAFRVLLNRFLSS